MSAGVRRLVAVVAGFATGLFIVYLLHILAEQLSPLPAGLDPADKAQVRDAFESGRITTTYVVLIVSGWLLGAFGAGTVASRFGRSRGPTLVVATLITAVVVADLNMMWHPTWMWLTGALGVPLIALGAAGESITVR